MANQTISKQHMLGLLDKLASDDGFRNRFEKNPKAGLVEAGVPAAQVEGIPADKLGAGVLAEKQAFAAERRRVANDVADECMCMIVPSPHWHPKKP